MRPRTTIEQWLTLVEVDKAGSIQAAANQLNKSHTTLIYAIKKLEQQLGVSLVQVKNRRAVLTDDGKALLRRAAPMLDQALELEVIGTQLAQGVESQITITIDHLCDRDWLYRPLSEFMATNKATSIQIRETSLSSTSEAVSQQQSDIAIINLPIANHLAQAFGIVSMLPVVSKDHPLALKSCIGMEDLLTVTQIVVRDLGRHGLIEKHNVGWLKSQQRITVDSFDHASQAVQQGLGFCRMPEHMLAQLDSTQIVQLPLQGGACYQVPMHLVLPKMGRTGPAATALYQLLLASANRRIDSL